MSLSGYFLKDRGQRTKKKSIKLIHKAFIQERRTKDKEQRTKDEEQRTKEGRNFLYSWSFFSRDKGPRTKDKKEKNKDD